jgi:hypothetical protein
VASLWATDCVCVCSSVFVICALALTVETIIVLSVMRAVPSSIDCGVRAEEGEESKIKIDGF